MFLKKSYILANELVQKMDIHIANISKLIKEDNDSGVFIKMNNCTFIDSTSQSLPNNIQVGLYNNTFTDMSDKLPCSYVRTEYHITENELFKAKMVTDVVNVAGKDFYKFCPEFVKKMKRRIPYILNEEETMDCYRSNRILGYTELAKDKYFTWY